MGWRERGIHRGGIESVSMRVWEGERERHRRELESVCESGRGRERKIERGYRER